MDKLEKAMYENLWNTWIQTREQPTPEGFKPVINNPSAPQNYFMTPEDMTAVLNAYSPYDLYMKPNYNSEEPADYLTSAFNIKNYSIGGGIENAILQASQEPQSNLSYLYSQKRDKTNNAFIPQAIYEHEVGHYQDPRLNPYRMWSYPNYGQMTYGGLSGGIQQREAPAIVAEDKFWDKILKYVNKNNKD